MSVVEDQRTGPVERRRDDYVSVGSATWYLVSALGLTVFLVICAVALVTTQLLTHPELKLDVDQIVKWVAVFVGAIIVGLFAGAGIKVVSVLDGQQAMLIRVVAENERTKGYVDGLRENPAVNIAPPVEK